MPVLGIGGLFFRAADPDALGAWYKTHLGIGGGCAAPGAPAAGPWEWQALGGPVVFQPFAADTEYFPAARQTMLNLRVSAIDALLDQLRAAGVVVITKPEWDDPAMGKFARIHDPEGNPIELWEPPAG
ncbi:VOC family protein [Sphingomonas sp.]|uniref:VOC family protein n=1 Tax=Sphingomonas sp. TaxID=28214 RepID=UPI003CC5A2EA